MKCLINQPHPASEPHFLLRHIVLTLHEANPHSWTGCHSLHLSHLLFFKSRNVLIWGKKKDRTFNSAVPQNRYKTIKKTIWFNWNNIQHWVREVHLNKQNHATLFDSEVLVDRTSELQAELLPVFSRVSEQREQLLVCGTVHYCLQFQRRFCFTPICPIRHHLLQ